MKKIAFELRTEFVSHILSGNRKLDGRLRDTMIRP